MTPSATRAIIALRATVGLLLAIHGVYRLLVGIVADFGGFLDAQGFPLGVAVAWLITVVEIVGGLALVAGYFVRPLCAWFAGVLAVGILLVHSGEGWFVVGGGRNGMEYSVLLIVTLAVTAVLDRARRESALAPYDAPSAPTIM